jgi:hypothetical protein
MSPFLLSNPELPEPIKLTLARSDREADEARRCESASRAVGAAMRNGVLGSSTMPLSSPPVLESMRGVPSNVPVVMSCFTAAGPSSEGVGEGSAGT